MQQEAARGRQGFSLTVQSFGALIQHARTIPALARHGRGLSSNHIREYLILNKVGFPDLCPFFLKDHLLLWKE